MFCTRCGKRIDNVNARFCASCGNRIDRGVDRTWPDSPAGMTGIVYPGDPAGNSRTYGGQRPFEEWAPIPRAGSGRGPSTGDRKNKVAALLVAVLVAAVVFAVLSQEPYGDDNGTVVPPAVPSDPVDFGEYTCRTAGDFDSGIMTWGTGEYAFNDTLTPCMIFSLDPEKTSQYGYFLWNLYNEDEFYLIPKSLFGLTDRCYNAEDVYLFEEYDGIYLDKAEAKLYWSACSPGDYTITVCCYASESAYRSGGVGKTYTGTILIDGTIHREYAWTYGGDGYKVDASFEFSEYRTYRDMNTSGRGLVSADYGDSTGFVIVDETVQSLSSGLQTEYLMNKGAETDLLGQDYADFILSFVQCCICYPAYDDSHRADLVVYGQNEYFAYPLETLYYGMGDCEDTSILAAALYVASGYSAAMVLVPCHALVGVAVDGYVVPTYNADLYEILEGEVAGKTYYAGETTLHGFRELGVIASYKSTHDGKEWYSEYIGEDNYGFYVVPA